MRTDSSSGEDGVHGRILKNLCSKGLNLLLRMINLSLVVDLPKTWSRDGNNFDISKASKKVWYAGHIDKLIGLKVPIGQRQICHPWTD